MNFSRRRFLLTTGASAAGALVLKGCLGNPPDAADAGGGTEIESIEISQEQMPETTAVKLGYISIVESAALLIAQEKGFFAKLRSPGFMLGKVWV